MSIKYMLENLPVTFFIVLVLTAVVPSFFFLYRLCIYIRRMNAQNKLDVLVKVSVIVPCKGTDVTFRENIQSLLDQKYPNFEVLFVTASSDDEAVPILKDLTANHKNTSLLVAQSKSSCGQKMSNMVHAVKNAQNDSEVYVFIDGDVYIHENFLIEMIRSLYQAGVGSVCGYHIFIPIQNGLGSLIRASWAIGGLFMLPNHKSAFSIGAATAIRRKVFEELGLLTKLSKTISDTFTFTNSIKAAGLKVLFEPNCLFLSFDKSTFREMLAWSNRLTIISHNYAKNFWWLTFLSLGWSTSVIFLGFFMLFLSVPLEWSIVCLSLVFFQVIHGWITIQFLQKILSVNYPNYSPKLSQIKWKMATVAPLVPLVFLLNITNSVFTNSFLWRGIKYSIKGPDNITIETDGI